MSTPPPAAEFLPPHADVVAQVATRLRAVSWAQTEHFASAPLLTALTSDLDQAVDSGRLTLAGTGSGHAPRRDGRLRGDSILWLDAAASPAQSALLQQLDAWRVALNGELWLGIEDIEAHFAFYPPGAGYARHRDRFRDNDARVLSFVLYLNRDWTPDHGGELRLHLPEGPVDIAPTLGSAVFFVSDEVEHEVRSALRERRSIAAWFRRRT